jgi:hypothetical protein
MDRPATCWLLRIIQGLVPGTSQHCGQYLRKGKYSWTLKGTDLPESVYIKLTASRSAEETPQSSWRTTSHFKVCKKATWSQLVLCHGQCQLSCPPSPSVHWTRLAVPAAKSVPAEQILDELLVLSAGSVLADPMATDGVHVGVPSNILEAKQAVSLFDCSAPWGPPSLLPALSAWPVWDT